MRAPAWNAVFRDETSWTAKRVLGQASIGSALLAIQVKEAPRDALAAALAALPGAGVEEGTSSPPKIVAAVSSDIPMDDPALLLWGIFTRFDPARDVFFEKSELHGVWPVHRGRMAIDATFKPGYPAALEMDPDIVARVDRRWDEYGISKPA